MRFLGRLARFWAVLLVAAFAVYLGTANQEHVSVSLPPWLETLGMPAYVAYMAFFGLGAVVASLFFGFENMRKLLEIRKLNKRLATLSSERPTFAPLDPAVPRTSDRLAVKTAPDHDPLIG